MLTPKQRLLRVLRKEPVDRPPVICTGGMMNAAIVEIMQQTGHTLPEAHLDPQRMAESPRIFTFLPDSRTSACRSA